MWGKHTVPILMYHKVEPHSIRQADTVTPETFRRQMQYLKDHGLHVLSLQEFSSYLSRKQPFPRNAVLITFDDGYKNNFTDAYPILRSFGFPAVIFISPAQTGQPGYLTWDEVHQLQKGGIAFGSHGMTQAYLPKMSEEQRRIEIFGSKKVLEENLGTKVEFFCYPVGGFNDVIKDMVRQAGYQGAMASNRGDDRFGTDVYQIKRVRMSNTDLLSIVLWAKVSGYYNFFRKQKKSE